MSSVDHRRVVHAVCIHDTTAFMRIGMTTYRPDAERGELRVVRFKLGGLVSVESHEQVRKFRQLVPLDEAAVARLVLERGWLRDKSSGSLGIRPGFNVGDGAAWFRSSVLMDRIGGRDELPEALGKIADDELVTFLAELKNGDRLVATVDRIGFARMRGVEP